MGQLLVRCSNAVQARGPPVVLIYFFLFFLLSLLYLPNSSFPLFLLLYSFIHLGATVSGARIILHFSHWCWSPSVVLII